MDKDLDGILDLRMLQLENDTTRGRDVRKAASRTSAIDEVESFAI